jgi:LPS sulfotransferase NodH
LHTLFSVADKKKSAFYLPAAGSKGNNTSFFQKQKTSGFFSPFTGKEKQGH